MLQAGFIVLTILLVCVLYFGARAVAAKAYTRISEENRFTNSTIILLIVWLIYIGILSVKDVFAVATFPPRIPLLLVFPPLLFFTYLFFSRSFKKIIENTPYTWPVYFQSFRIVVELLLLGMSAQGMLPKAATFEGYNYDILIGITAPMVGYYINDTRGRLRFLLLWNFAGLATLFIVVCILMSHSYFYAHFNETESILSKGFGVFPYTYLAGFFMPIAVFMHVFSIIKTRQMLRNL